MFWKICFIVGRRHLLLGAMGCCRTCGGVCIWSSGHSVSGGLRPSVGPEIGCSTAALGNLGSAVPPWTPWVDQCHIACCATDGPGTRSGCGGNCSPTSSSSAEHPSQVGWLQSSNLFVMLHLGCGPSHRRQLCALEDKTQTTGQHREHSGESYHLKEGSGTKWITCF